MATTHNSQSILGALDTAVAGTTLNALTFSGASTAFGLGAAINNTPSDGTTISYDMCDVTVQLASAVVSVAPAYITIYILPSVDGTNYPSQVSNAAPLHHAYTFDVVAGSVQTIVCPNIPIPPSNFKVLLQNSLGINFPASGNTCQMMRKTTANW